MSRARAVGDESQPRDAREGAVALRVRALTAEEATELRRRVASRTLPARAVERARMGWAVHAGGGAPAGARRLGGGADGGRGWGPRVQPPGPAGPAGPPPPGGAAPHPAAGGRGGRTAG